MQGAARHLLNAYKKEDVTSHLSYNDIIIYPLFLNNNDNKHQYFYYFL